MDRKISTNSIVGNNLYAPVKDMLHILSHYSFRERLKYKCTLHNVNYIEIDESYTSRTCGNCDYYKKDLGAAKVFNCDSCKIIIDRDVNGARNILMKYLLQ